MIESTKGTSARRRHMLLIAPLLLVIALAGAGSWLFVPSNQTLATVHDGVAERDKYAQFVDREAPSFTLSSASGDPVSLADFRGKPVILNFIYARCTDICPPHIGIIADLQDRIDEQGLGRKVEFVTVATDTEDAAETMGLVMGYGARFDLQDHNWRMLYRGERDRTAGIDVASEYGLDFRVNYASDDGHSEHEHDTSPEPESQTHGAVTHVIDPEGRLRARFHGLGFEPQGLVTYVQALVDQGRRR